MKDCQVCASHQAPLGKDMSVAIGAALAKRMDKDPSLVYVLTGDGELDRKDRYGKP